MQQNYSSHITYSGQNTCFYIKNTLNSYHLGNVLATVLDRKTGAGTKPSDPSLYDHWSADLASTADYYPGGMMMPGRNTEYSWSRMGMQSQQKDDEIYGKGNTYTYQYRMNDARIIRFFSPDPLRTKYPYNSDYAFAENSFIAAKELEGLEKFIVTTGQKDGTVYRNTILNSDKSKWDLARFAYADPDGTLVCFANVGLDTKDEIHAEEIETSQASNSPTKLVGVGVAPPAGSTPVIRMPHTDDVGVATPTTVNATDLVPPAGQSYNMELPIAFQTDKSSVYNEKSTIQDLKRYAQALKDNPSLKLTVLGNTSYETEGAKWKSGPTGSTAKDLMRERANTIKGLFVKLGVSPTQITTKLGKSNDAVSADAVITNTKSK